MKIHFRIFLLLSLIGASLFGVYYLKLDYRKEHTSDFFRQYESEKHDLFLRLEKLSGVRLESFVYDYSWWTEMVMFVTDTDPDWAQTNIIEVIEDIFAADAAWVYTKNFDLSYAINTYQETNDVPLPVSKEHLTSLVESTAFPLFYIYHPAGVMEVRGGPIQRGELQRDVAPVEGYLFIGRILDEDYREELAALSETEITVCKSGHPHPDLAQKNLSVGQFEFFHEYRNTHGELLLCQKVRHTSPLIEKHYEFLRSDARFMLLTVTITYLVGAFFISVWVLRPLQKITLSLDQHDTVAADELTSLKSEFGQIGTVIKRNIEQRKQLESEISIRTEIEEALQKSESNLRQSLNRIETLGRDLHDCAIQSIYAIGLQSLGCHKLIRTDPKRAEDILESMTSDLNSVIQDLRGFIEGLEPTSLRDRGLYEALDAYAKTIETSTETKIDYNLNAATADILSRRETLHIFHIIHEITANAIRHAGARNISCHFERDGDMLVLSITNDGIPIDQSPSDGSSNGFGIANVFARAKIINASVAWQAQAKKTCFTLKLPLKNHGNTQSD